jgi:hypothetical protein
MTDKLLTRHSAVTMYDAPEPFATMDTDKDGSYIHADELRERLVKALADAPPDGTSDALRDVLSWLGDA